MLINRQEGYLDVDTWVDGRFGMLRLAGEFDAPHAARVRALLEGFQPPACYRIVVDASELRFIDSQGIGVLIGAAKRATTGYGGLAVVGVWPHINRMIEVMGLTTVLRRAGSIEAAFALLDTLVAR